MYTSNNSYIWLNRFYKKANAANPRQQIDQQATDLGNQAKQGILNSTQMFTDINRDYMFRNRGNQFSGIANEKMKDWGFFDYIKAFLSKIFGLKWDNDPYSDLEQHARGRAKDIVTSWKPEIEQRTKAMRKTMINRYNKEFGNGKSGTWEMHSMMPKDSEEYKKWKLWMDNYRQKVEAKRKQSENNLNLGSNSEQSGGWIAGNVDANIREKAYGAYSNVANAQIEGMTNQEIDPRVAQAKQNALNRYESITEKGLTSYLPQFIRDWYARSAINTNVNDKRREIAQTMWEKNNIDANGNFKDPGNSIFAKNQSTNIPPNVTAGV